MIVNGKNLRITISAVYKKEREAGDLYATYQI